MTKGCRSQDKRKTEGRNNRRKEGMKKRKEIHEKGGKQGKVCLLKGEKMKDVVNQERLREEERSQAREEGMEQ